MMTIVSETTIEPGQEPEWDRAYRERLEDAPNQEGWISLQLLIPLDAPNRRVVVGTWRSRADWEAWHGTEVFRRTREQMDNIQQTAEPERWYEVVAMAGREDSSHNS
jgi:heme-degrading monooxygenase HmoA